MDVLPGKDDSSNEDDDAKFLMVIEVLGRLLPHLVTKGVLQTPDPSIPLPPLMISRRQLNKFDCITREFIEDERHKILSLQMISDVQSIIRLHDLPLGRDFFNPFMDLARCQARFLLEMEIQFYEPYSEQRWRQIFAEWRTTADRVTDTFLEAESFEFENHLLEDHLLGIVPFATSVTARVAKELEIRLQAISEALRVQERLKQYANSLLRLITKKEPATNSLRLLFTEKMAAQARETWFIVSMCCADGALGFRSMTATADKLDDGIKELSSALTTARLSDWDPKAHKELSHPTQLVTPIDDDFKRLKADQSLIFIAKDL